MQIHEEEEDEEDEEGEEEEVEEEEVEEEEEEEGGRVGLQVEPGSSDTVDPPKKKKSGRGITDIKNGCAWD